MLYLYKVEIVTHFQDYLFDFLVIIVGTILGVLGALILNNIQYRKDQKANTEGIKKQMQLSNLIELYKKLFENQLEFSNVVEKVIESRSTSLLSIEKAKYLNYLLYLRVVLPNLNFDYQSFDKTTFDKELKAIDSVLNTDPVDKTKLNESMLIVFRTYTEMLKEITECIELETKELMK